MIFHQRLVHYSQNQTIFYLKKTQKLFPTVIPPLLTSFDRMYLFVYVKLDCWNLFTLDLKRGLFPTVKHILTEHFPLVKGKRMSGTTMTVGNSLFLNLTKNAEGK